jgi:CSLREA domain-containing protein
LKLTTRLITAAAALVAGTLLLAASASAATISVTTTVDAFENGNGDGQCSLREAVETAVTNTNKGGCGSQGAFTFLDDVVEVPAGLYPLTIPSDGNNSNDNATGSLGLEEQAVTIRGVGAGTTTIDAGGDRSLFTSSVGGGNGVAFENLVLQNGRQNDGGLIDLFQTGLRITNSTLRGGVASTEGGAIHTFASVDIRNSTFSGNSANEGGGAISLEGSSGGTIANTTITANNGDADNDGGVGGGLLKTNGAGDLTITNTIIAGNTTGAANTADCAGTVISSGNNLFGSAGSFCKVASDVAGTPQLAPLADNGGKTLTHALLAGSPALEKGTGCIATDQRGVERFLGGACDIGSYELVSCDGQTANRVGSPGDDALTGTEGDDVFLALDGNDTIDGAGGNDLVCAGAGNDTVNGGAGNDRMLADAGDDRLSGGDGDDTDDGGAGNDTSDGGGGNDTSAGGDGNDTAVGGEGNDSSKGGEGDDRADGGAGNDTSAGDDGNDTAVGGAGNDRVSGQAGKDVLKGNAGKDRLNGGAGKDKLAAGGGKDRCIGSGGKDTGKGCERESSIP